MKQWDRFSHVHWGVLAHSTHLRGAGTYDAETGEERLRVRGHAGDRRSPRTSAAPRTSATSTRRRSTSAAFEADPDTLVVPRAGEMLFRLR